MGCVPRLANSCAADRENLLRKTGDNCLFQGGNIGGTWLAIEGSQLAEIGTAFAIIKGDFTARERLVEHARTTVDDEAKIATIVLPIDHLFIYLERAPAASL